MGTEGKEDVHVWIKGHDPGKVIVPSKQKSSLTRNDPIGLTSRRQEQPVKPFMHVCQNLNTSGLASLQKQ